MRLQKERIDLKFTDMNFHPAIQRGIRDMGFTEATPIQKNSIPPALEGRGIGGSLVRSGLEYARTEGLTVRPLCPFVAAYIAKHPEYRALVH